MQFRVHYSTIWKSDSCYPLDFSPVAATEISIQPIQDADPATNGDGLDMANLGKDLEVHKESLAACFRRPTDLALTGADRDAMMTQLGAL